MRLVFPASYLSNQLSMTGLLVTLGLNGNPQLAADVGIVQGAALALFLAFSGNARNLILKSGGVAPVREIALVRLMLVLPLSAGVYYLGALLGGVAWDITSVLILRKAVEWLTEIHLGEAERDQDAAFAFRHLVIQSFLLAIAAVWILVDAQGLLFVMLLWALLPLLISLRYFQRLLSGAAKLVPMGMMLPHLGSSAVTGIGFYVFRLALLLLAGKAVAGDLYTAFAIGGLLGSIFAMGLGPSLVLHEQNSGQRRMPAWLLGLLALTSLAGLAISGAAHLLPGAMLIVGKPMLFWQALGFSLIGGVVMVFAHRQRLRDLQHGTQDDVFAPDVLVNMLVVIVVPASFFVFGLHGLSWLYLINAAVALIFYWMADVGRTTLIIGQRHETKLRVAIAALLVVPVFLTLGAGLFRSEEFLYNSAGLLSKLPVPLSVFACYAGIILLGNFRRANLALATIFLFFVLMVLATVATTSGNPSEERAKLLLLLQYVLPTFGLSLGMMYEGQRRNEYLVEKAVLVVIAVLMPAQLLASWMQSSLYLTPYLYLFSVYQHLQYVPVVVASSFLVSLFSLWDFRAWRILLITVAPVLGIYIVASGSLTAAGFLLVGCAAFAVFGVCGTEGRCLRLVKWTALGLVSISGALYHFCTIWIAMSGGWGAIGDGSAGMYTQKLTGSALPVNLQDRLDIWSFHLRGVLNDPLTFLFGHSAPPDRTLWPSAHNYYLDVAYNFGVLAALVIVGLVVFTIARLYQHRKIVSASSAMAGLAFVVLFLVIPDNIVKVSLRQPYPGIFAFFLWGLLLARIDLLRTTDAGSRRAPKESLHKDSPLSMESRLGSLSANDMKQSKGGDCRTRGDSLCS